MTVNAEKQLEEQLGYNLKRQGFKVVAQKGFSQRFHWKPDFIIERSGKHVVLEVKSRPAMMSDISVVGQIKHAGLVGTLLCMPPDALERIPGSVQSYAQQLKVRLCSTNDIEDVLNELLN
jgi:hypothetical protein